MSPVSQLTGVKSVDPRTLKNHSLNITLYGEDLPQHLVDSIQQYGIREPITVCRSSNMDLDGVVVSGRRRRVAAIKLGIKSVPIVEWKCEDEDELKEELILRNIRAELTIEQRGRMAQELLAIEARLAAARRGQKTEQNGRSIDKVAAQVGLKPTTAMRVVKALENIDEMKADGREEEAAEVVETLNKGKVTQALAKSKPSVPDPSQLSDTTEINSKVALLVKHMRLTNESLIACMLALDDKHKKCPQFSTKFVKFESIIRGIDEYIERPMAEVARLNTEWRKTQAALAKAGEK